MGGSHLAQLKVGMFYESKGDLDQAIYWYTRAALAGNEGGNQARFKLGLPDVSGNYPVNRVPFSSSEPAKELDSHTAITLFVVGAAIAISLLPGGGEEGGSQSSGASSDKYCEPCISPEREAYGNQCQNSDTGALRFRICY